MKLTARQQEAQAVLSGAALYLMLFGGSRSGKTFLHVRNIIFRALKAPGSRHAILRFRFNHLKASIVNDTFPKVMALCFPDVKYHLDKSDWFAKLPNGSEVWFGGLDEKERTEKILGMEFATIYLNECSQIPWASVQVAVTRLAQQVNEKVEGRPPRNLKLRMYFDCNPPSKAHWTYKVFVLKVDPETGETLRNQHDFQALQMNPRDNAENLAAGYLDVLQGMAARMRKRFLDGEFADATPNQLFREEDIEKWRRISDDKLPDFVRVVVGVDPSGSGDEDNADNDEIGVVVGALGTDGNAYLLDDSSLKAGPGTWGATAGAAFDRHAADVLVGETNYGGDMVRHVVHTARPRTPFKKVTATRGKHVRAEPFSALYEQGKVRHVGEFRQLEAELCAMSTTGYTGVGSPNRADAWIWVLAELFPGLLRTAAKKDAKKVEREPSMGAPVEGGWMK